MFKMATYPGMTLGGEIRESISLDDDDLSDVEDEVFIRDGKNGYKFAEDVGVKRPLMAPRRKLNKPDLKSRLKNRPPCRPWCKPCCYLFGALTILTGIIVLVVIIVSLFPLPIDKIKDWIVTKAKTNNVTVKLLPCSDLKVAEVWSVNLPKFTSESSIRTVDIDGDGNEDIIFGFGTGDNSVLLPTIFCPMFLGVTPPCGGGVVALNGTTGEIVWRKYLAHTVFSIFCSADLNGDAIYDCVATGKGGIFVAINSRNGLLIWEYEDADKQSDRILDIYTANFIPDQDNDGTSDIIAAHTSRLGTTYDSGHIIVISGKTGKEIQRLTTPSSAATYYMPQLLPMQRSGEYNVIVGTGSPSLGGNLSVVSMKSLMAGNSSFQVFYKDVTKGILSPSILVDITGDGQLDIISAMFNSTIVAFDGNNFTQLWNFTVANSETLSLPTPGYFNDDNVTDFLVKYQTGPEYPIYYYSQVYIIDGKTGKPIYEKAINDSVGSQMAGLTISMEGHGHDFFVYWMADCKYYEGAQDIYQFLPGADLKDQSNADLCLLRFNSTKVAKLYALNQYEQPPGLELYNSDNHTAHEYNNSKIPTEEAAEYLKKNPQVQVNPKPVDTKAEAAEKVKSPFRHKSDDGGLVKDYGKVERPKIVNEEQPFDNLGSPVDVDDQPQDTWQPAYQKPIPNYQPGGLDYNYDDMEPMSMYGPGKQLLVPEQPIANPQTNRDPRGDSADNRQKQKTLKKNLSDGIYDYKNIKQSRNRLLHDLNDLPTDILKETYFKNREQQLRKNKFEQRDLKSHIDKMKENEEVERVLEEEKKRVLNVSENLWDLESEKEMEERKNGYWRGRRRRDVGVGVSGIPRISSTGVIVDSGESGGISVDLVFLTYWTPAKTGLRLLIEKDYQCIANKIKNALNSKADFMNAEKATSEETFKLECLRERGVDLEAEASKRQQPPEANANFPDYEQISQLSLGQMTVYRIRIECQCTVKYKGERCAKMLSPRLNEGWTQYLNRMGDGVFVRK